MDASNSGMSDESLVDAEFPTECADPTDAEAPTERDPRFHDGLATKPPRGVALSVLWWLEGDAESTAQRG
jgi:hypothetical protein